MLPDTSGIGQGTIKVEYRRSKLAIASKAHHGNSSIKQRFSETSIFQE
jgi:hypothetical protein